jgi:hypothetical protein
LGRRFPGVARSPQFSERLSERSGRTASARLPRWRLKNTLLEQFFERLHPHLLREAAQKAAKHHLMAGVLRLLM